MREVELKSVVDDVAQARANVESAGGKLVFEGTLRDRRYDRPDRSMVLRDEVLRLRIYESKGSREGQIDWKGSTGYDGGFKIRDEITSPTANPEAVADILDRLGYVVIREIDRTIAQYELNGALIRFEEYPYMDSLVEVEGEPATIERAIESIGLPRTGFTSDRLVDFVVRFEARTGRRAAVSDREATGDYRFAPDVVSP